MGDDQAMAGEAGLGQSVLGESQLAEGLGQFNVAARRDRQDELELSPTLFGERGQLADILQAQQPAFGDQNDALD